VDERAASLPPSNASRLRQRVACGWVATGEERAGRRLWWLATAIAGWALWRASEKVGAGGRRRPRAPTLIRLTYDGLDRAIVS
jgi:hypothetical protein